VRAAKRETRRRRQSGSPSCRQDPVRVLTFPSLIGFVMPDADAERRAAFAAAGAATAIVIRGRR